MAKNCRGFLKVCTNGWKEGGEKLLYEESNTKVDNYFQSGYYSSVD